MSVLPIRVALTVDGALWITRMVWWLWGVSLALSLALELLGVLRFPDAAIFPSGFNILTWVSFLGLVVAIPVAYFLRNQIYKSNWRESVVTPGGYTLANLFFFWLVDGLGFILVFAVASGEPAMPGLIPFGIAMVIHGVNYPTGRPMQPAMPRLGASAE